MQEALIIDAIRSPMGRYRGALAGVRPDDLAAHVVAAAVERNGIDPQRIAVAGDSAGGNRLRTPLVAADPPSGIV